jgi:uncharacterized protein
MSDLPAVPPPERIAAVPATTDESAAVTGPDPAVPAKPQPGWPEIVVGVGVFLLVSFGTPPLVRGLDLAPGVYGLALTALSGVAGVVAFAAAVALRVRALPAFGWRRPTWRWVAIGMLAGLGAWLVSRLLTAVLYLVVGDAGNVQAVYVDAGTRGPVYLVLSLVFLAGLTPLGEELVFRGVVTTAMLRWGTTVGVVGSSVVFAAVHGWNPILLVALVNGLVGAELLRRSGSVWPAVLSHVVNNGIAQLLAVTLASS